jgi:hypothetical protein
VLLGLSSALAGCGSDEPPPAPQPTRGVYQGSPYQVAPGYPQPYAPQPQQQQWGIPGQQAPMVMQPWPQAQAPAMQGQAPVMSYPPADNPWQKPPAGFGGAGQAPQMMWQQAQPAMPQFRPLEQDKGSEYRSTPEAPAVAPYDRPIGSSQDRQQQPGWPGAYYPGGAGYPGYSGYPGYPGYPGAQPGYWGGTPAPWGMPGMSAPWPMW